MEAFGPHLKEPASIPAYENARSRIEKSGGRRADLLPRPCMAAIGDSPTTTKRRLPRGFVRHAYERSWNVPVPRAEAWCWLNDPRTFTDMQVWPYFVEFADGGFQTGVRNTHSGPGIHFPAVLGEIREGEYRDLIYLYGAYAFGMRIVRPLRLQFWLEDSDEGCLVRLRLDCQVRGWFLGTWKLGNRLFWSLFGRSIRKGVVKRKRRIQAEGAADP